MGFFQKMLYFIGLGVIVCMGKEPVDHETFFSQAVDSFSLRCIERFGIVSGDSLWVCGMSDGNPRMAYFFTSMIHSFRNRGISLFGCDSVSSKCPKLWITVLDARIRYEKIPSRFFGKNQVRRLAEIRTGCRFCREIQSPLEAEFIEIQKADTIATKYLDRLGKGAFLLENASQPSMFSFRNVLESILAFVTIGYTIYLFYSIRSD